MESEMDTSENVFEDANESLFDMTKMAPPSPPPRQRKPLTEGQRAHIEGKMGDYEVPDITGSFQDIMDDINEGGDDVMEGYVEDFGDAMADLINARYAGLIKSSFARAEKKRLIAFGEYEKLKAQGEPMPGMKEFYKAFPKGAVYSSTDTDEESQANKLKKSNKLTKRKPLTARANRKVTFSEDTIMEEDEEEDEEEELEKVPKKAGRTKIQVMTENIVERPKRAARQRKTTSNRNVGFSEDSIMEEDEEEEPENIPKKAGRTKMQARTETNVDKPKRAARQKKTTSNRNVMFSEDSIMEEDEEEEPEKIPKKAGRTKTQARTENIVEKPKRAARQKKTTSKAPAKAKIMLPRGKIN